MMLCMQLAQQLEEGVVAGGGTALVRVANALREMTGDNERTNSWYPCCTTCNGSANASNRC